MNQTQEKIRRLELEVDRRLELDRMRRAWGSGDLRCLLRQNSQLEVFNDIERWRGANKGLSGPFVTNIHRGWGKSHFWLLYCFSRCLKSPAQQVRYGAPAEKQCLESMEPLIRKIMVKCPQELKPERRANTWYFQNPEWPRDSIPSTFTLFGCQEGADSQRNKRSNLIVLDECRDIANLDYVVHDVLGPHFIGQEDPFLALSSTPPIRGDHPWWARFRVEAMADGRYALRTVNENTDFTPDDRKMLLALCGGEKTTSWKREALCELAPDETRLVVPEFKPECREVVVVEEYQRPSHFRPWVGMDCGWFDYTGVVFAYSDFKNARPIVERTMLFRYKTTRDVAEAVKRTEIELWGQSPELSPIRVADGTPQQLQDLARDYDLFFEPVDKSYGREGHWAALAQMRSYIKDRRLRIVRRGNESLIDQLRDGLKNERGTDFERDAKLGHLDALMALAYLLRKLDLTENPYPPRIDSVDFRDSMVGPAAWESMEEEKRRSAWSLEPDMDEKTDSPMPWEPDAA